MVKPAITTEEFIAALQAHSDWYVSLYRELGDALSVDIENAYTELLDATNGQLLTTFAYNPDVVDWSSWTPDPVGFWYPPTPQPDKPAPKCDCGAEKTYGPDATHSDWCAKGKK